ncbi:MAG: hypothetical protein ACXQS5_04695 [Candidatus Methanospirareceae archaeon]
MTRISVCRVLFDIIKPLERIIIEIISLGIAEKKRRMLEGLGVRVEKKAE